jgi:flavin reductase (DIM6/NTAB) family NADH-FMN oxidoreductase RutF/DNA-binding GntR family transcriptional regulator
VTDQAAFRDVIGRFASGVTVVTTTVEGKHFGTTASAMSSLSLDPPMLLVCLNRTSATQQAILATGRFGVNILSEDQADVAEAFAVKSPDKFRDAAVVRGELDVPLIPGSLAQIECRVSETATGGTHTVFLAEVERAEASEGAPLTYYRGRFGRFEDQLQDAAYRRLRELVLARRFPVDEPLEVERLSADLALDRAHIFYALTKLASDGLASRAPDGTITVRPLTVRAALQAIDARCAIEAGVADLVAGAVSEGDVADLRRRASAVEQSFSAEPADLEAILAAGQAFHERFVDLLGNDFLADAHQRLALQAIWARSLPTLDWARRVDASYLSELVEACARGDADTARRVLRAHAAQVRDVAREAIEAAGGAL